MDKDESIVVNGSGQDNEMKNFKKRTKNCFLMFCEVVLKHEGIISEPLNSSQESISEHHPAEGIKLESIENSTFNSDSDSTQNEMVANYDAVDEEGGGGGDSFNSVTCFCGKPFAGRPMIECSGCLTWLHMSCAKVKRKNIPEFYYCDACKKSKGVITTPKTEKTEKSTASSDETGSKPSLTKMGLAATTQQTTTTATSNGTTASSNNNNGNDAGLFLQQLQQPTSATKPRKQLNNKASNKKTSSSSESDSAKILKKTNANGKLRKIRQKLSPTTKKIRQALVATSPTAVAAMRTKGSPSNNSSAAQQQLTLVDFNSSSTTTTTASSPAANNNSTLNNSQNTETVINGIIKENINSLSSSTATSQLKSALATNNNNIYNNLQENSNSLNGGDSPEKYGGKKLKL